MLFFKCLQNFFHPKNCPYLHSGLFGGQQIFSPSKNPSKSLIMCFACIKNGWEWNSEHFYLCWNGLEQNYQVLSVFLFYKMVRNRIWRFFIFLRMAQNGIPSVFRFPKTDRIPTEWIKISVCSVFCEIIFFSENGNPIAGSSWS
jgi:hypothetical protein